MYEEGRLVREWLLEGLPTRTPGPHARAPERQHHWWQVMCLTGVDYFSTLGYQPGIAFLAAGALSPIATLFLVALTLLGALPIYRRVARESPHGEGSIAMLERLLPRWAGKLFVLALLGFVATDFVITITLSAADATAHALENPYVPHALHGQQVPVTLLLVFALGAIFMKGFTEAIRIAVVLVLSYLALNTVVVAVAVAHVAENPHVVHDWQHRMVAEHPNPFAMVLVALIVFPRLALGLSGFETGVAVMPLIKAPDIEGRIRGARLLLTTAALIMSVFLIASSFCTTVLIPAKEFDPGGRANGRALAYVAHEYLGNAFGTVYDVSTIAILWFAGASAMAGLLNIVPRYLPRYGMAPEWIRAPRPLVLVFLVVCFAITLIFRADVDAQGGAYATGVLVLILSATVAVTIAAYRRRERRATIGYAAITVVFAYTTVDNIIERPDGVKIASAFIVSIVITSLISRATRSTELRVTDVGFDDDAARFLAEADVVRIVANEPDARDRTEYDEKAAEQRYAHNLPPDVPLLFLELSVTDASEFATELKVIGEERHGYRILRAESTTVPNAIAAALLEIRDRTGKVPHVYFSWTEGNPVVAMLRYMIFGDGDVAPLTREILRLHESDARRRPYVHVG
jgi:hypothetical protein